MTAIRWLERFTMVLMGLIILPGSIMADEPTVSNIMVTDVTTVSFSVIWASSEPATASIEVFQDDNGSIAPVTGATITSHPLNGTDDSIKTLAENNGVMKVRVTGLTANTEYYFRTVTTSKSTSDVTDSPAAPDLMSVFTEYETVRTITSESGLLPFSNDLIIHPCYQDDGETPAEGTLLMATVTGGNYPVSAFVGDCVPSPYALIDLNNVFSREFNENIDLHSGENLTLHNFRGLIENSIVNSTIPLDNSLIEVKSEDSGLQAGRNMVSFQLEPNDTDISEVLAPVMDNVVSAWAFDADNNKWLYFIKDGLPFLNTLHSLSVYTGFYLYLADADSFAVNGSFGTSPINLKSGRNLVGYRSIETLSVDDAFAGIYSDLISIWHFDVNKNGWIFFINDGLSFLNTLHQIEPGKAYWVYVQNDCVW